MRGLSIAGLRLLTGALLCISSLCFCASAAAEPAVADSAAATCDRDCIAVGQWHFNLGVGLGMRLNPLADAEDTPLILLPEVSYYGSRFFLRNLDMGFTLLETPRHQVNLLATPSYDQMYFNRWDPLNFTFAGGASGAAGGALTASPPAPGYTDIKLTGRVPASSSGGDLSEELPDSPVTDHPGGEAPVQEPVAEVIGFSGRVNATPLLEINGTIITTSGSYVGAEGNMIDVNISEDRLAIDGLGTEDEVNLRSNFGSALQFSELQGHGVRLTPAAATASAITIDAQPDGFVIDQSEEQVGGESPAEPAPQVSYRALQKRRISGLAGLEYSYTLDWMSLHVQALQEFTGVHHGQELRLAVVLPWDLAQQRMALTLGANYKSQKVFDYYYGIDATEAQFGSWVYQPASGGAEALVRLDWQKPISSGWSLRAKLQYLGLASPMIQSPLVDKDYVFSAFFGGVYHF